MKAMGDAYTNLLADRNALLFQMQSYAACADPDIQTHVRERFATLVRQVQEASGATPADLWSFFSHGMLLNVIAALNLDVLAVGRGVGRLLGRSRRHARGSRRGPVGLMLDRLAAFIYRRRRRVLWGSLAVVLVAGFFGGPVFGLLDSNGDFDDPQSEAPLASRDIARATNVSAAPDLVALVRLGAPADSAQAQRKLDRVAAALRVPGLRLVRYERGGDRSLVSKDGRSTYVAASFPTNAGGVLDRVQPKLEAHPRRDARRQRHRPRPGRDAGVGGHRAGRAARLPDPLPAVAVRVPQRGRRAAPARGRRRRRSCSRSSRCGSSTRRSSRCRSTR